MFNLIFSLAFVFVAFIAMLIGALKAKKKIWQLSIVRLVRVLISASLGAIASSIASWYISVTLISVVDLGDITRMINEISAVRESVVAVMSMIIAPIIFLPIYLVIRAITRIFEKKLTRLFVKITEKKAEAKPEPSVEEIQTELCFEAAEINSRAGRKAAKKKEFRLEKSSWISALCGAACGLMTLCVITIPIIGSLCIADDMLSMTIHSVAESDESGTVEMVADIFDASAHNAGAITVRVLGGDFIYDLMTTHKVGGHVTSLRSEAKAIKAVADAFANIGNESSEVQAQRIRQIPVAFEKSDIFPLLLSELACSSTSAWEADRDFYGISKPAFSEEVDELIMPILRCFSHSTVDTIKEDVYTVSDIVAILVENHTLDDSEGGLWAVLAEEQAMSGVFFDLLENERLCILIDEFSDFGIRTFLSTMSVPQDTESLYPKFVAEIGNAQGATEEELIAEYERIFDKYGLRVEESVPSQAAAERAAGRDVLAWVSDNVVANQTAFVKKTELVSIKDIIEGKAEISDNKKEAAAMAHAFALMENIEDISEDVVNGLRFSGPMLEAFTDTETIGGERTHLLLKAIFQSETICSNVGLSLLEATDTANDMSESAKTKGYITVMKSFEKIVEVLEAATDQNKDTREPVRELLNDLTPDSAKTISNISTPGVVKNYGVSDKASKPVSNLISDVFTNLSNSKEAGMSEEEYEKEAVAVADMMDMLMSVNKEEDKIFGENSKTGISATEFVNNMMDSSVTIGTIVEKVYAEGDEPTIDPLYIESDMDDEERAEFIEALNAKYQKVEQTEENMKGIISVASILNVEVKIVDGKVVDANPLPELPLI